MRVSPAIWVKGISGVKSSGSANPNDRFLREGAKAGRQRPCTFDTLNFVRSFELIDHRKGVRDTHNQDGAGFKDVSGSSNDGRGSNPLPARSDGLDDVDGGPDAGFYIQIGVIEQVSIRGRL